MWRFDFLKCVKAKAVKTTRTVNIKTNVPNLDVVSYLCSPCREEPGLQKKGGVGGEGGWKWGRQAGVRTDEGPVSDPFWS